MPTSPRSKRSSPSFSIKPAAPFFIVRTIRTPPGFADSTRIRFHSDFLKKRITAAPISTCGISLRSSAFIAAAKSSATHERLPGDRRRRADRVRLPDCGRINHQIGITGIFGPVLGAKTQPEPLQAIDFPRFYFVRTANVMSQLEEQGRDAAHPAAGHADEMNPMALARQHLLQIQFRGEHHDLVAYIFPSFRPRARPRFSARDARKLAPSAEADSDARSTRESFARAIRPSGRIPLRAGPRRRERKSPRSSSGDPRPRKEMESGSRAVKMRPVRRGLPRLSGRWRNRPRCKLLPSHDETPRRALVLFPADNCRPRGVRRARPKDGSPGWQSCAGTATP